MRINIEKTSGKPIYIQIRDQIRDMIISNILPQGFLLPPERKLSQSLGVNRSTVLKAYQELKADGFIDSRIGSGTFVLPQNQSPVNVLRGNVYPLPWYQYFNKNIEDANKSIISDIIEFTSHEDIISFAGGMPSPKLYPIELSKEIFHQLADDISAQMLQNSPVEGYLPLRESIVDLLKGRGISANLKEVMILSGSQQGLDYATRVFLNQGDIVVTEDPTYLGAVKLFKSAGARVMGMPVDEQGMRVDMLESLLSRYKPKLIYTLPTFQNPTGAVMSLERRYKLLDLAYKYQIPVLEDDPYGDIRYEGAYVPPLKALDKHGYVMYLSTFSKVMFMGFRVGWIAASQQVIERFALNKQISDFHVNTFAQCYFDKFLRMDGYAKQLRTICKEYKSKRDAMLEALEKYKKCDVSWVIPEGGYYIWCKIPECISQQKLVSKAAAKGVVFVPGDAFHTYEGYKEKHIRLNYTFPTIEQIDAGIRSLMEAIELEMEEGAQYIRNTEYVSRPIV
ncbi:MAG: PLP-dependent aminotransferase family protein [Bacillota bacterium]